MTRDKPKLFRIPAACKFGIMDVYHNKNCYMKLGKLHSIILITNLTKHVRTKIVSKLAFSSCRSFQNGTQSND
jgi:hypothetical protein